MSTFIPEIASLVIDHLRPHDLQSCVRVCKSWRDMFLPLLYWRIIYQSSENGEQQGNPRSCQVFQQFGHHIRALEVKHSPFPDPAQFGPGCRLLNELRVGGSDSILGNGWTQHMMALIDNNPHIHTLWLSTHHLDFLISDQKILRRLPELKDLGLALGKVRKTTTLDEILACGPRLERLQFAVASDCVYKVATVDSNQEQPALWKLSSLTLWNDQPRFSQELMRHCPNLRQFIGFARRLAKHGGDTLQSVQQMVSHLHSGHPFRLQRLELMGWDHFTRFLALEELLTADVRSSGLSTVKLRSIRITDNIIRGLTTAHAQALVEVSLRDCHWDLDDYGVHDLLSECPGLRCLEVEGKAVYMEDLVRSPWVCKDLEVLSLNIRRRRTDSMEEFCTSSANDRVIKGHADIINENRCLWHQIGEMTNLQTLHVYDKIPKSGSDSRSHVAIGDKLYCLCKTFTMQGGGVRTLSKLNRLAEAWVATCRVEGGTDLQALRQGRPSLRIKEVSH
ncbi:MAG: hypothetical protein J3Q66DRAFT_330477 [Benniella sp.]|nr:MAG: hypothetical protein J3Q66DRAFT_330477 [Benniella sp.]